jgi:hypothetical protein
MRQWEASPPRESVLRLYKFLNQWFPRSSPVRRDSHSFHPLHPDDKNRSKRDCFSGISTCV